MTSRAALALAGVIAAAAASAAFLWWHAAPTGHADHDEYATKAAGAMGQRVVRLPRGDVVSIAPLSATDGSTFDSRRLTGRWSAVFFGFTRCPDVCPTTLQVLSGVARDPRSGVEQGLTQIVFVTVDPGNDTVPRLKAYLSNFDARIVGLTGDKAAIDRFASAAGAAYSPGPMGFEHSTSVYLIAPDGRLAAVMPHAADARAVASDLESVRRGKAAHVSLAH